MGAQLRGWKQPREDGAVGSWGDLEGRDDRAGEGRGRVKATERGFATRWTWALIAFCYFAADLRLVSFLNSGLLCKVGEKAELTELFTSFDHLVIQQKVFRAPEKCARW